MVRAVEHYAASLDGAHGADEEGSARSQAPLMCQCAHELV
jgi:hypothetical protein